MKYDSIRLESGKEYNLGSIFCGNNKVVIPDLQRDYCWGDIAWNKESDSYSEIVTPFLDNLWSLFQETQSSPIIKTTLGMIYGYEHPSHQINLCDGQQRITTLYLLLGMLNRRTIDSVKSPYGAVQNILISEDELNSDDREPFLLYSIRESSLYFLSDLVYHFFINDEVISVEDIKMQGHWYFREYDNDPTIKSMLSALGLIENFLNEHQITQDVAHSFALFISKDLFFLYYDMGDRLKGEETFVVINTTGEPLSSSENIKPILLGDIKDYSLMIRFSKEWEDRENWFWHRRRKRENTADDAYFEFLKWVAQINLRQEKQNEKDIDVRKFFIEKAREDKIGTLEMIQEYFKALSSLVDSTDTSTTEIWKCTLNADSQKKENSLSAFRDADINLVLPLLHYVKTFPAGTLLCGFIRRVRKNYFDNTRNRGGFVQWRYILKIIDYCKDDESSVLLFDSTKPGLFPGLQDLSVKWYGENEAFIRKLEEFTTTTEILEMENHPDLMGDLSVLRDSIGDNISSDSIARVWKSFCITYKAMYIDGIDDGGLSNLIRLYKVLIGHPQVTRPYRTSGMVGTLFSWLGDEDPLYYQYLSNKRFHELLRADNLTVFIKQYLREHYTTKELYLEETEDSSFNSKEFFKAWLVLKTVHAGDSPLSYTNHRDLVVYDDCSYNKIDKTIRFSAANAIAGYAVKAPGNYIAYANNDWWNNKTCLDCPLVDRITIDEFSQAYWHEGHLSPDIVNEALTTLKLEWERFIKEDK